MDFNKHVIKRLEDIGSAKTLLSEVLKNELFDNLSKHNPYWDSEDSIAGEKLYDVRIGLRMIEEKLFDILTLFQFYVDEEE